MDKDKIMEFAEQGISLTDGEDKEKMPMCCRNCEEGYCPLLALFEKIKQEVEQDNG
jgi:hypothetical protein